MASAYQNVDVGSLRLSNIVRFRMLTRVSGRNVFASVLLTAMVPTILGAGAAPVRIVAIGASNTSGWLIPEQSAYPAILQRMLGARGIDVQVTNAGVPFDTTAGMLARLDSAVPKGTDIVILQPGGNDLRFFGSKERRTANIEAMRKLLQARSIRVIVYDNDIPWRYVFDGIHLTPAGHQMIAAALLPRVLAVVNMRAPPQRPKP
jgi:acyl-CoA thioesterase I